MREDLPAKIESALWGDVHSASSFATSQPLLAHYTSIEAFESILASNEIWFSNPLYMNDWEELRFGMSDCAQELLFHDGIKNACNGEDGHGKLIRAFDYFLGEFEKKHAFDTYVYCLANHDPDDHDGRLSMWRGYGANGSGVALVFKSSVIPLADEPLFMIDRVEYATTPQRREWIRDRLDRLTQAFDGNALAEDEVILVAHEWVERIKIFSLFSKHHGFREEDEWRVVYMAERDKGGLLKAMLGYAITSRGVVPKLKVPLAPVPGVPSDGISLENLIERIILGPTASSPMAVKSVSRMLDHHNRSSLVDKIVPSMIPFRP